MGSDDQIVFDLYGDESIVGSAVVYGVVVVPTARLEYAEHFLEVLKTSYGGQPKDRIHCKEMFNREARRKTAWAHLDDNRVHAMLTEFARGLASLCARPSLGYVNKNDAPASVEGIEGRTQQLDDKNLTVFAFGVAVIPVIRDAGRDRVRVWVDPDRTKIGWWGQRRQVLTALGFYTDLNEGDASKAKFGPEPQPAEKPYLIDAADLLAYTAAHVLNSDAKAIKPIFQDIWKILSPVEGEFHFGMPPDESPAIPGTPSHW